MPVTPVAAVASAKPGSFDHRSQPITLMRGSSVAAIDAHALDRARRGALAAADLRAFERGSGRARAGEQPAAVAEDDLGVGADVDQQRHRIRQIGPLGEHDARGVGADVPGDARQHVDARVAVNREVDLGRPQRQRRIGRERERRAAQLERADAEQQVMHDRIADERRFEDVLARDARLPRDLRGEIVDRAAHDVGQLLLAAGIHHHPRHAAHQVFAEADLRIHRAGRRHDFAARQVAQDARRSSSSPRRSRCRRRARGSRATRR